MRDDVLLLTIQKKWFLGGGFVGILVVKKAISYRDFQIRRNEAKIPIHEYDLSTRESMINSLLPHRGEPPASPQNQVYQRGGGAASTREHLSAGNRFLLDQHSETVKKRIQRRRRSKRKYRTKDWMNWEYYELCVYFSD